MQQPPPPPPPPLPTKKHKYKNVTRSCLPPKQTHEKENINRSRAQAARQRIKKNKHIKNKKIHKVPGPIRKAEDSPWTQEKGLSMAPLIWDRAQAKKKHKKTPGPGPNPEGRGFSLDPGRGPFCGAPATNSQKSVP